uniref:Uncharacterized protein n=1 Tax=Megaselia scalaris TaxID=36166 RepID=T1H0W3_MEGSC
MAPADINPSQREVTPEQINSWCENNKMFTYLETSSKTATNVTEAFSLAVKQWRKLEKQTERELRDQGDTIDLTKGVTLPQNRICCSHLSEIVDLIPQQLQLPELELIIHSTIR